MRASTTTNYILAAILLTSVRIVISTLIYSYYLKRDSIEVFIEFSQSRKLNLSKLKECIPRQHFDAFHIGTPARRKK